MDNSQKRRTRFDIKAQVKVYEYIEEQGTNHKGAFICDAISWNVSYTGIRLYSKHKLDTSISDYLVVEFSLIFTSTLIIPSKLIRAERNKAKTINLYAYDYAFEFDFTNAKPGIQDKLISDIFQARLQIN